MSSTTIYPPRAMVRFTSSPQPPAGCVDSGIREMTPWPSWNDAQAAQKLDRPTGESSHPSPGPRGTAAPRPSASCSETPESTKRASTRRGETNSWACGRGHLDTLRVLMRPGCPGVDDRDVDGWTPLAWAILHDDPHTIETLVLTECVDLERRDHGGRTAVSWAVEHGHRRR
jgi:hypothetical protein